MLEETFDKIQESKNFAQTLSIKISGDENVTDWFKNLCSNLTSLLSSLTKYIKRNKEHLVKNVKDTIPLYLHQMTATLSLLIKIFLKEKEVEEVISEARHCVLKQLTWCLDSLSELLSTGKCVDNSSGSFIKWMDSALDKIAEIDIEKDSEEALHICEEVRPIIEEVLCHAMSIAQVALLDDCKIIKGSSHTVLETLESLSQQISRPEPNVAMCNLFVDCLSDKLCTLERKVNTAVLKLTLKIFSQCTKPLDILQEYCFNSAPKTEEKLDALIADFDMHVDRIMQIGLFAVACSTDVNRCVKMRSCLASLEALEGELVPAFTAVSIDPSIHNTNFALLLKGYWVHQSQILNELIYLIIDPTAFCQVSYDRIKQILDELADDVKMDRNYSLTEETVQRITSKADVLKDMIKFSVRDVIPSNIEDVKEKYNDFSNVLHEVKSSAKVLLNGCEPNLNSTQRVLKRCKILLAMIKRLLKVMNETDGNLVNSFENSQTGGNTKSAVDSNKRTLETSKAVTKSVLLDITNKETHKEESDCEAGKKDLLDEIVDKGKQILKERSVLYKTPTKLSVIKKITSDLQLARSSELPLSRLVHLRKLNFCNPKARMGDTTEITLDLQITDILNDLTSLSQSILK